ncbi:pantetheine-phosphate adenylyltransferase [Treponema sp. SP13]|uniref:pantetheine-phosphate adenylyltransferase n=1 Tax=Treponema sp. SP13 TaxID=2789742 RepID=UPI003D91DC56
MTTAVFPGSFDPPTNGHLSIIKRASKLFDTVDVVIAVNANKQYLFTKEERYRMMEEIIKPYENVTLHLCSELVAQYAKKTGANVLLRGIRNTNDFAYEFDLSLMNHMLNPDIETLFIPTEQRYVIVKSSSIKELAQYHGDISSMVPPIVEAALKEKFPEAGRGHCS